MTANTMAGGGSRWAPLAFVIAVAALCGGAYLLSDAVHAEIGHHRLEEGTHRVADAGGHEDHHREGHRDPPAVEDAGGGGHGSFPDYSRGVRADAVASVGRRRSVTASGPNVRIAPTAFRMANPQSPRIMPPTAEPRAPMSPMKRSARP